MFFINFIEAFIFPLFLSYYYDLKNKLKFILLSGLIQFTVLNLCTYYNQSGYPLTVFIILFNILSLLLSLKRIHFEHVFLVIIYNMIIVMSTFLGITIKLFFSNYIYISLQLDYYIVCCIAKFILFLVTYILLNNKQMFQYKLDIKSWNILLIFQITLVTAIVIGGNCLATGIIEQSSLVILTIVLIILNFSFYSIINKIESLNKERLEYQKQLQQEEFNKSALMTMKNIKNEIDAIDHRLFYVLLELEDLLKKNDINKSIEILNKYKDLMTKRHLTINTKNSIFDCLMSLKINDMLSKDINVKTVIAISQKTHYNDLVLVNFIIDMLNQVYDSIFVNIHIQEMRGLLRVSIQFEYTNIDLIALEEHILEMVPTVKAEYRLIKNKFCEMRFAIMPGDYE